MPKKYDFGGYATRFNVRCSDGRTICHGAFKDNDGEEVSLVWQHLHDDPGNVIGHAVLEERNDGMYAYCTLNDTQKGRDARELIRHGDVNSLSIYANKLKESNKYVTHGLIREVSLVISGANPHAKIDQIGLVHGDMMNDSGSGILVHSLGLCDESDPDEGEDAIMECIEHGGIANDEDQNDIPVIPSALPPEAVNFIPPAFLAHADANGNIIPNELPDNAMQYVNEVGALQHGDDKRTVKDIINSMTDEQKLVLDYLINKAYEYSKTKKGEDVNMKHNVFEGDTATNSLAHVDMKPILDYAHNGTGSLKNAVEAAFDNGYLQHSVTDADSNTVTYGMANIGYLFPDARNIRDTPDFIKRDTEWVSKVMNGTKHTPFSRVRSIHADITMDEARAKGYIKGNQKVDEVFTLLKRTTDPQTVYKKQKLDRDDIIDITSFDVVAWIKSEMRVMLDEELARAILIGDGRMTSAADHISHDHIRPIWTDDDLYTIKRTINEGETMQDTAKAFIQDAVRSRKLYKGSGNPTLFTTEDMLCEMLLIEDGIGHRLYPTVQELASVMRVDSIVTVPVMENQTDADGNKLCGIIVNLKDYNVGADKGGSVNLFDDFDINVNQYAYLIETRCSGALTVPYSAIVISAAAAAEEEDEDEDAET